MTYKNALVGIAVFISSLHLLAVAASAQDDDLGSGTRSSRPAGEKSVLAAADKSSSTMENNQRCYCVDEADSAAAEKIKQVLRRPLPETGLDYSDTPLTQVISDLQDRFAIPIHLDRTAMEELGVSVEEPVTINLRSISLQATLRLILRPLGLTHTIENEVLLITTRDAEEQKLITCVYDVRDLAALANPPDPLKGASAHTDFNRLIDVITNCIAKETWSEDGGPAEIRPLGPDLLVVSQTRAVQEKIQNLLSVIRRLKPGDPSQASSDSPSSSQSK